MLGHYPDGGWRIVLRHVDGTPSAGRRAGALSIVNAQGDSAAVPSPGGQRDRAGPGDRVGAGGQSLCRAAPGQVRALTQAGQGLSKSLVVMLVMHGRGHGGPPGLCGAHGGPHLPGRRYSRRRSLPAGGLRRAVAGLAPSSGRQLRAAATRGAQAAGGGGRQRSGPCTGAVTSGSTAGAAIRQRFAHG